MLAWHGFPPSGHGAVATARRSNEAADGPDGGCLGEEMPQSAAPVHQDGRAGAASPGRVREAATQRKPAWKSPLIASFDAAREDGCSCCRRRVGAPGRRAARVSLAQLGGL
jgi:hypothetical protein